MSNLPDPDSVGGTTNNQQPAVNSNDSAATSGQSVVPPTLGGLTKEQEPFPGGEGSTLEEVGAEIELSPELEKAGLEKFRETIELPPDVRKMGVQAVGPSQPVTPATTINLPLTDDQILVGLHAQIITSLRWLAEWCIRRLKQIHVHLKKMGGKVVREQN